MPLLDVEGELRAWLAGEFPDARVVTEVPGDLTGKPVVQVTRIGGPRDLVIDYATVDIDVFATDRIAARTLALALTWRVENALPGVTVATGVFAACRHLSGPEWRPWDDDNVRRFGLTYQIVAHSTQPAA